MKELNKKLFRVQNILMSAWVEQDTFQNHHHAELQETSARHELGLKPGSLVYMTNTVPLGHHAWAEAV